MDRDHVKSTTEIQENKVIVDGMSNKVHVRLETQKMRNGKSVIDQDGEAVIVVGPEADIPGEVEGDRAGEIMRTGILALNGARAAPGVLHGIRVDVVAAEVEGTFGRTAPLGDHL